MTKIVTVKCDKCGRQTLGDHEGSISYSLTKFPQEIAKVTDIDLCLDCSHTYMVWFKGGVFKA